MLLQGGSAQGGLLLDGDGHGMQFYFNSAEGRVLLWLPASPGALEEHSLGAERVTDLLRHLDAVDI